MKSTTLLLFTVLLFLSIERITSRNEEEREGSNIRFRNDDATTVVASRKLGIGGITQPPSTLVPIDPGVSAACNGNGNKYSISEREVLSFYGNVPACNCFDCYSGENCQIKGDINECEVDAGNSQLDITKSVLPFEPQMSFSNQYRMKYQSFREMNNSTEIKDTVFRSIKDLHRAANNVKFDDHQLLIGLGAHQLIQAAMYALSPNRTITTNFYCAPPYWGKFPKIVNAYDPANVFVGDYEKAMEVMSRDEDIIDLITSPSNPGNTLAGEQQLLGLPKEKQIWDLVYYWPSSYANKSAIVPLDENIMIFSLSKLAGYAGHRFGWAWVKDPNVVERMNDYLSVSTQSYPASELIFGTRVIQTILGQDDFFGKVQDGLMERCKAIEKIFKDGGDKFQIESPCGNMYVLVKCTELDTNESCQEIYFEPIKLNVTDGKSTGIGDNYVRIAIGYEQSRINLILEKLKLLPRSE